MDWCVQLITFVLGFLTSLLVGIILFYWQFKKSIAGYRLNQVTKATNEILTELTSKSPNTHTLRNRHRYSLGVILDRMARTFGSSNIRKQEQTYPCLQKFRAEDRWETFNKYVRPVIDDINNYSFIGWVPFFPDLKRLRSLVRLLIQIETVTAELDAVRLLEKSKGIKIFLIIGDNEYLKINEIEESDIKEQVNHLLKEYQSLEDYWNKWIKLIEK